MTIDIWNADYHMVQFRANAKIGAKRKVVHGETRATGPQESHFVSRQY